MATPRKIAAVSELTDALSRSKFTIVTDYRGLTVAELQILRSQLRPHQAEIRVAKNTLTKIAARATDREALEPELVGPTALVTAFDDPVQPAKIVSDFVRTSRILQIRAAMLDGVMISVGQVEELATLPSRDVLLGKIVGGFSSPLYGIVGVLAAPIRSLQYVLQARAEQLGGSEQIAA
ncbi:MAG TPA: 50S ribosomal protein L10 [Thermomicrobiales bacterium]|nr:50S ribosomal protein L10 [Thermomicrobiales bacterium]